MSRLLSCGCPAENCRCPATPARRRGPTGATGSTGATGGTGGTGVTGSPGVAGQTGILSFSGTVTSGTDPGGVTYSMADRGVGSPAAAAGNIHAMPRAINVHTLAFRARQVVGPNVIVTATLLRNGINILSASLNSVGAGTVVRDPAGPLLINGLADTYECQVIITRDDSGVAVVLDVTVTIGLVPV